jgi:gas vesicle protein GvpO
VTWPTGVAGDLDRKRTGWGCDVAENGHRRGSNGGIAKAIGAALEQFEAVTHLEPIGTTGVRREEDGWSVLVDAVELERVPATTSVVATYRVDVDDSGQLRGLERLRRFVRGSVDPS